MLVEVFVNVFIFLSTPYSSGQLKKSEREMLTAAATSITAVAAVASGATTTAAETVAAATARRSM